MSYKPKRIQEKFNIEILHYAIYIIVFVVIRDWIVSFFRFEQSQSLFLLSIILVFALSLWLAYKWLELEHFKISLAITTIVL